MVVETMLTLGLRKGEALGLTWADVDLDGAPPALVVRRGLKKDGRGGVELGEPNAGLEAATAAAPVDVERLRRHRVAQAEARLAFGAGWGGTWPEMVFTRTIGTPLDLDRVNRDLQALTEHAGLGRWTPHELRHGGVAADR